ncbi:AMP-binding protein [Sporichthya polymorpha]|uniref:AMP-binding protein n=1 Tax=Sporichthya polymorpha TaxID=35751 RepID=UPI0005248931|nr:AMP-binding protein [Sporichthya polymorpha]
MRETGTPFGSALEALALAEPDRPAVTCEDRTVSRAELLAGVRAVAAEFSARGVRRGDVVSIGLPNCIELVQALFATWWIGATPAPFSHRLPAAERRQILELAAPALVVGEAGAEGTDLTVEQMSAADRADRADREPGPALVSPVWKIITSGGSTGRPKLIVSSKAAVAEDASTAAKLMGLPYGGCVLMPAPLSHSAPFSITVNSLLRGSHVVLMTRFDPDGVLELIERHRIGWCYLVPTMMQRILRLPDAERLGRDVGSVEIVFHMAAPCPAWLKRAWIDWLGADRIWEMYGGSEGQAMCVIRGDEWLEHPGSVGRPAVGEIEVRDESGDPLEPGLVGELWLRRGAGAPSPYRYIGAEARASADGWESLGDMGRVDSDGYVYITDRRTDMFVVGGANVYPAEIEAVLDEHPAVRSSCVIGLPHEDLGSVPHALIQLAMPVEDAELFAHVRDRLAPYKVPRSLERTEAPLRDDAGKVRRSALRAERLGA